MLVAAQFEEIKSGSQKARKMLLETQDELLSKNSEYEKRVAQLESECATLRV